jgi:acetyl esterase/lipase
LPRRPHARLRRPRRQGYRGGRGGGVHPPTDLSRLAAEGYLPGLDRFVGGSLDAVPGRYRNLSPVSHVDPGDPPTFLAYGGSDQIVPPGQSELLEGRLQKAGVARRLVDLPWANHTFDFLWGGWGSQITRSALDKFLRDHLKDTSPPQQSSGDASADDSWLASRQWFPLSEG